MENVGASVDGGDEEQEGEYGEVPHAGVGLERDDRARGMRGTSLIRDTPFFRPLTKSMCGEEGCMLGLVWWRESAIHKWDLEDRQRHREKQTMGGETPRRRQKERAGGDISTEEAGPPESIHCALFYDRLCSLGNPDTGLFVFVSFSSHFLLVMRGGCTFSFYVYRNDMNWTSYMLQPLPYLMFFGSQIWLHVGGKKEGGDGLLASVSDIAQWATVSWEQFV